MEIVLAWLVFAAIVGAVASTKGRSGFGWFLISILLSPLLGLILVLILPAGGSSKVAAADTAGRRPCPRCGEQIVYSASVCRFCNTEVTPMASAPVPVKSPCRKCGKSTGGWYRPTCQNCGAAT